jgi:hypothetical protein
LLWSGSSLICGVTVASSLTAAFFLCSTMTAALSR